MERVPHAGAVPGAVADYLAAQNLAPKFVLAPNPELWAMPWSERPMLEFHSGRAEATDMVSVQHGFVGVAETGTLMLPAAPTRPTTLNLLPDTEIVVLKASGIVAGYEDAFDRLLAPAIESEVRYEAKKKADAEAIKVFQTSAAGRRLQAEMPNLGSAMAGPLVKFQMQLQPEIMRAIQGAK